MLVRRARNALLVFRRAATREDQVRVRIDKAWQHYSAGPGSKGPRYYAWAWVALVCSIVVVLVAVFVPTAQADAALEVMKKVEVSQAAVRVGKVEETPAPTVVLQSRIGGNRVVDMLSGEQLPRIC